MKKLKIGTRGSALALWQARYVKSCIDGFHPEVHTEITTIKTKGDRILEKELHEIGGKGVFVKEIEDSLLNEEVDLAVHSLKDLPAILPDSLVLGSYIKRQTPFDILVSRNNIALEDHGEHDRVGTGSLRRKSQLLHLYPDLNVVPVRGNVDTRLKKVGQDGLTSVVLAGAGLERLGLTDRITRVFDAGTMVPAPGQGIIAVECREKDDEVLDILLSVNDYETELSAILERSFLKSLGGDCSIPAGCYSEVSGDMISATGVIVSPDGESLVKHKIRGNVNDNAKLGSDLARILLEKGGEKILFKLKEN